MHIVIAGGGIGGLSAALCFLHAGHKVTVIEQAPVLAEVGAGIQLPPNAMRVFSELGLAKALTAIASAPTSLSARMGISGRQLFHIPLQVRGQHRWGAPYLHLHRADYIAVLHQAFAAREGATLILGTRASGYQHRDDRQTIEVQCDSGEQLEADLLIGADGIHSVVAQQISPQNKPTFSGHTAWRAVIPMELLGDKAPEPSACVWMGAGRHAVSYRLRGGELANFVGVVESNTQVRESWSEQGERSQALQDFAGWHPTIGEMIKQAPSIHRWGLYDRAPLKRWVDGRAVLLGDAAHPMLPFMAQGAAMAVEDAWTLAQLISSSDANVAKALGAYTRMRMPRCGKAYSRSSKNAAVFHRKTAASQFLQYAPMWVAGKLAPALIAKQFDWLYGYDPIAQTE